jgi:broad specificity phosphatase PhoE
VTLVLLVRHGLTAGTGTVLTGRTPGIPLDDRGRAQAGALAARLADVPLDAIITSPLDRCRETAEAIAAARDGSAPQVQEDEQFAEVKYGDWTGQPLKRLAKEPLWRVVQAHPSAVRFPGKDAESMPVYVICSHGDVIKAVIADSLGLHLDLSQRIQVDPCSLSVIRYTPLRPFLVRMNDTGRTAAGLARPRDSVAGAGKAAANGGAPQQAPAEAASRPLLGEGDAAIGGGAGG